MIHRLIPILFLTACAATAGLQPAQDAASLRAEGPAGLERLLNDPHPEDAHWVELVDQVAAQKDAATSGLYWYTDREEAVKAGAEQGKPVLSLRMLGKLTDSYSCANSRFFRTVLYANPEVAAHLQDHFVLHWSSERAVPKITIEMGDGRTLVSTITGNSAHYVLDARGLPLDVLPGLYTPDDFLAELDQAEDLYHAVSDEPAERSKLIAKHHQALMEDAFERLQFVDGRDPRTAVLASSFTATLYDAPRSRPLHLIPASDALPMALGKGFVEVPMTNAFLINRPPTNALHPNDLVITATAELHPVTQRRIRAHQPAGGEAILSSFANTLQRDSTWNRDVLHTRIRQNLIRYANGTRTFDELNQYVYANVFGTPAGDPWLGLYDPTVYSALPNGGVQVRKRIP